MPLPNIVPIIDKIKHLQTLPTCLVSLLTWPTPAPGLLARWYVTTMVAGLSTEGGQMAPLLLHILCTCSGGTSRIISGKLNNEQVQLLIWSLLRYINKHVFGRHNTTDYFLPIIFCMMKWGCKGEINGRHYPIFVLHLTTALTRILLHTERSLTASLKIGHFMKRKMIFWDKWKWSVEFKQQLPLSHNCVKWR